MLSDPSPATVDFAHTRLKQALRPGGLTAAYQPIVLADTLDVVAHEGYMRIPDASPIALINEARHTGHLHALEVAALRAVIGHYLHPLPKGKLFVNLSCRSLLQESQQPDEILKIFHGTGHDLNRFVIELTERDIVEDVAPLAESIAYLRAAGLNVALDDFGNGHSNFEMWNELHPEFVKLDRYLVHGISGSAERLAIVKALCEIAETLGAELIAEGIERPADLVLIRDLGIKYAQGYLIARPTAEAVAIARPEALEALTSAPGVPVHPVVSKRAAARTITAGHLLIAASPVAPTTTNNEVSTQFSRNPELHAVAVVDNGMPVGIINRRNFMDRFAQPYHHELYGRRACTLFMNSAPVVCDESMSIEAMSAILRGDDQRYLSDGFIITQNGCYLGLGTGETLVRRVTELRVEAARFANPLTLLPGNMPITEHIGRVLGGTADFAVAYLDLNHFKPFNDQYGYFRGDGMIRLVSETIQELVNPTADFLGHIGGDDFIVIFQSKDWALRCERIIWKFNAAARTMFSKEDLIRGGFEGENRHGQKEFFPLTTLIAGVVRVTPNKDLTPEQIGSSAANAKHYAKKNGNSIWVSNELSSPDEGSPAESQAHA